MQNLIERDILKEIKKYLGTNDCIVLHGARQVGKTHILYLLKQFLDSKKEKTFFLDLEDTRKSSMLDKGVDAFISYLKGEGLELKQNKKTYIFIDEIQYLENPSSFLKLVIDHYKNIQLIVSGSSSFEIKSKFKDSLVGRTVNFEIFNLNFREFLRFNNKEHLLNENLNELHLKEIQFLYEEFVLYGGYPKIVLEKSIEKKEKYLQQIADTYVKSDIRDLAKIKDLQKFNNLIKILASQSGQILNISKCSKLCSLTYQTIEHYLFILEQTYIIKLLKPYSISASVEVIKAPKIFFYDTGLMQILYYKQLQKVLIGNAFETSIFSELVKKYNHKDIYYWRNKNQNEIDFILQKNNDLIPIEVKENFDSFNKKSMEFFLKKYSIKNFNVISLRGFKQNKNYIFPWELI